MVCSPWLTQSRTAGRYPGELKWILANMPHIKTPLIILQDLFLLASLIMIGMMVFGSLEYFIEMDEEDTGFYSIPQGMWWAVQTLTSLGYGDFPVQTIAGNFIV